MSQPRSYFFLQPPLTNLSLFAKDKTLPTVGFCQPRESSLKIFGIPKVDWVSRRMTEDSSVGHPLIGKVFFHHVSTTYL